MLNSLQLEWYCSAVRVSREPEVARQSSGMTLRSMRVEIINHVKERTWSLSWYSGDQLWQLMVMLNARYCRAAQVPCAAAIIVFAVSFFRLGYKLR